jgi:hypothetical protein
MGTAEKYWQLHSSVIIRLDRMIQKTGFPLEFIPVKTGTGMTGIFLRLFFRRIHPDCFHDKARNARQNILYNNK